GAQETGQIGDARAASAQLGGNAGAECLPLLQLGVIPGDERIGGVVLGRALRELRPQLVGEPGPGAFRKVDHGFPLDRSTPVAAGESRGYGTNVKRREILKSAGALAGEALLPQCGKGAGRIDTVVYLMMENRSYDHV